MTKTTKQYLFFRGLYDFLVNKEICKPLEQVKREQKILIEARKIEAAKDHLRFMKTTIFKKHYKNKTWKDFYNSNN